MSNDRDVSHDEFHAGRRLAEVAFARRDEATAPARQVVLYDVITREQGWGATFRLLLDARVGRASTDEEARASQLLLGAVIRWNDLVRCEVTAVRS